MKIQITKAELANMLQKTYNIDLTTNTYEISIEGYIPVPDSRLKASMPKKFVYADTDSIKVTTDKNLNVLDLQFNSPKQKPDKRRAQAYKNLQGARVDYSQYKEIVLDFATSSDKKRKISNNENISLACLKERYKKAIRLTDTTDMVKFSSDHKTPYLIRRK